MIEAGIVWVVGPNLTVLLGVVFIIGVFFGGLAVVVEIVPRWLESRARDREARRTPTRWRTVDGRIVDDVGCGGPER